MCKPWKANGAKREGWRADRPASERRRTPRVDDVNDAA